jgi:hypothetical protein
MGIERWSSSPLLQAVVAAASALVLLVPATRTPAVRLGVTVLVLCYFVLDIVAQYRSGELKKSPGEIYRGYRSGKTQPASPLRLLAGLLGCAALIFAT